ncbi:hypothetical protein CIG66_25270 (plasmid) [Ralstonia pseudosolanacearum]|nr:hypothetical protein CIG66_16930 [Ralstonia pseudosolanacearum]AST89629.1 hypothetical protein CIG66_25270 [Ralstonia pseudosolanacearum]
MEISVEEYAALLSAQDAGRVITAAANGSPIAVERVSLMSLEQAKAAQGASIRAACEAAIEAGFVSQALGSVHTYPSTETDQRNLLSSALASQGRDSGWTSPLWCATDAGQWAFLPHSAAQVQQVNADWIDFRDALRRKYAGLVEQISAATSMTEVEAITW